MAASRGFTLIELLIVVAIIGLLVSLSIPAIQASREAARRAQCTNNQRQFGVAFTNIESAQKAFPSGVTARLKGPLTDIEWQVHNYVVDLLPYIEERGVDAQYHRDAMFCAPENATAIATVLAVAICPSAPRDDYGSAFDFEFVPSQSFNEAARTNPLTGPILKATDKKYTTRYRGAVMDYAIPSGASGAAAKAAGHPKADELPSIFSPPMAAVENLPASLLSVLAGNGWLEFYSRTRAAQITDGLSNTFLLTEVGGRPEHWQMGNRTHLGEPLRGVGRPIHRAANQRQEVAERTVSYSV